MAHIFSVESVKRVLCWKKRSAVVSAAVAPSTSAARFFQWERNKQHSLALDNNILAI